MSGYYHIEKPAGHFELFRTSKPRFRAEVDLHKPHPEIRKIQWLDQDVTDAGKAQCISEALEYLDLFVLMGE